MNDRSAIDSPLQFGNYAYLSQKLEKRRRPDGSFGVFAMMEVEKDEVLTVMGGIIVTRQQLNLLPLKFRGRTLQVEENLYQVSIRENEPADFVNHSCNPNGGMSGQVGLVAMKNIVPDEEVTFDYAMSDSSNFDEFRCNCGSHCCRQAVTGEDWKLPDLWRRYDGYFSPYLQRRIDILRQIEALENGNNR